MSGSVTKRECLPCTACCQGWLSADVLGHAIRAGHPCPHSTPQGCGIYQRRPPKPCQSFICSWLVAGSPLPDWMRPDVCGAIVLLSLRWEDEWVISAVPVGRAIPERTLEWLKSYAARHQRPLLFYERIESEGRYTGLKRYGYGPPSFRDKVARLAAQGTLDDVPLVSPPPER